MNDVGSCFLLFAAFGYLFLFAAYPLPCLNGCSCFYSIDDDANTVNCSYNNMTQMPNAILPDTEQLIMAGNNLQNMEYIHKNWTHLATIDLQRSNITQISSVALKTLLLIADKVVLSNNKLKEVPGVLQTNLQTQIWLSNNPFLCNCDMMWMRDLLQNATNVMEKGKITCAGGKWNGMGVRYFFAVVFSFLLFLH